LNRAPCGRFSVAEVHSATQGLPPAQSGQSAAGLAMTCGRVRGFPKRPMTRTGPEELHESHERTGCPRRPGACRWEVSSSRLRLDRGSFSDRLNPLSRLAEFTATKHHVGTRRCTGLPSQAPDVDHAAWSSEPDPRHAACPRVSSWSKGVRARR